jgi:hypothetical protein
MNLYALARRLLAHPTNKPGYLRMGPQDIERIVLPLELLFIQYRMDGFMAWAAEHRQPLAHLLPAERPPIIAAPMPGTRDQVMSLQSLHRPAAQLAMFLG